MARIDTLANFITDVATAIKTKTGKTDPITPANFDTEITSIEGGSKYAPRYISFRGYAGTELDSELAELDTSNITSMKEMFYGASKITSLNLQGFIKSSVTSTYSMFQSMSSVTSIDLSNSDMSNVTTMYGMFQNNDNLTDVNLSGCITKNVTTMENMFSATKITSLDLSGFDTSQTKIMKGMFNLTRGLTEINISSFTSDSLTDNSYMFYGDTKLSKIIINNPKLFKMTNTNMFTNTGSEVGGFFVYVPDDMVETYKTATNWSTYADNIKPISELPAE